MIQNITTVNLKQPTTKLKSTPKKALLSRKEETATTSRANKDEISSTDIKNIMDIIREAVKEELDSYEKIYQRSHKLTFTSYQ